jgi:oxygen-independent coproporphyrinogen III oxidase
MTQDRTPRAAYVHVPFCVSKCHYCDFNSYPGLHDIFEPYVHALIAEIARSQPGPTLETIFLGGGTPTVLPASSLISILSALRGAFGLDPDAEVTIEANPGTARAPDLANLRAAGFNRISLGIQSFDDSFLRRIGRAHTAAQAREAYESARLAGFDNVSLDLIFALPGQTISHWAATLDAAVALRPEHISTYELTIEEGTRFAQLRVGGSGASSVPSQEHRRKHAERSRSTRLDLPPEDDQIAMYELAIDRLTCAGYEHYEVSNFAVPGFRCRHNLTYWRNDPYLGFGAGATSYLNGVRAKRIADPRGYVDAIQTGGDAIESSENLTGRALLAETIIQGIRLLDGIDLADFTARTAADLLAEFGDEVTRLRDRGLIEVDGAVLRATRQGLLLLNDVASEFLP